MHFCNCETEVTFCRSASSQLLLQMFFKTRGAEDDRTYRSMYERLALANSDLCVDVHDGAECWLSSADRGWGLSSALNRALIRLIHGALVYKRPPHNRRGLIACCPRRVVASVSVLFLGAGKTKVPGRKRGKQPQGSCETAPESSTSGLPARIAFHLTR